jgi:hypothetical protein
MNWLYAVLENWLAKRRAGQYVRDKNFRVAEEHADKGLLPIEILTGPFKGTVFVITNMEVLDDYGKSRFDHRVIIKQPGKHDSYYGPKFSGVVGEILLICLTEAQSNYKALRSEVLSDDECGTDCLEEPVEERTISAKVSALSKARLLPGET